jgi:Dyp-type peroxidase family
MRKIEMPDVQGILVSGYRHARYSAFCGLRISNQDAAREWLSDLVPQVTTAARSRNETALNIAFTAQGLSALGLAQNVLSSFATAFIEGLDAPHRASALGDVGASEPGRWDWGHQARTEPLHILLLLYASDQAMLNALLRQQEADFERKGITSLSSMPKFTELPKDEREHFGFRDGISNPVIAGTRAAKHRDGERAQAIVQAGEFILGYDNELGLRAPSPRVSTDADPADILPDADPNISGHRDLGRNGTYLVLRQLRQDVAGFWRSVAAEAERMCGTPNRDEETRLAAKMIGRWPSGAPLAASPERDDPALGTMNDFGYALEDSVGLRCPLGAHIRRANPRDSLDPVPATAIALSRRHRLIRRGRSYGPRIVDRYSDDCRDRGVMFLCANADFERQFEFVQQTWMNNPKFANLFEERDPLNGVDDIGGKRSFTIPAVPIRQRLLSVPRFISVRGGAYMFMPSLAALRYLAAR